MNRSSQQSAIVLAIRSFGESHAMVDLLTMGEGLVPAVAYGLRSRRSSLRGKVVPFARGVAWLYRDPRQERSKITDFEVERYAVELQHDLSAYYHASLWAEVVWRTHAAGGRRTGGLSPHRRSAESSRGTVSRALRRPYYRSFGVVALSTHPR
ncbi:MAG: recombination protein O N-terminal domain-containing protein, partial [Spirochaetales bacterium]|nr:recombination protein O N-terminal domain-containing protein [Spirochaetales bacterium]